MDTNKHIVPGKGPAAPAAFPTSTLPAGLPAPSGGSVLSAITIGALVLGLLVGFGAGVLWNRHKDRIANMPSAASDIGAVDQSNVPGASDASVAATSVSSGAVPAPTGASLGSGVSVSDQSAGSAVKIDDVKLAADGWVAVHDLINGQPGNALGAQFLSKGDHAAITVNLLRATKTGSSYVVLVQDDADGNKKFENKIDMPEKNADGTLVSGTFKTQ